MRELGHLLNLGYVHIDDIDSLPGKGDDLRLHVHIQAAGREFLALRTKVKDLAR